LYRSFDSCDVGNHLSMALWLRYDCWKEASGWTQLMEHGVLPQCTNNFLRWSKSIATFSPLHFVIGHDHTLVQPKLELFYSSKKCAWLILEHQKRHKWEEGALNWTSDSLRPTHHRLRTIQNKLILF
jgi:hypothetical protein